MAEDLIQKYIDRASFAADTKFAIEQLAQLEKEYTKLRDFKISLTGSTGTKDIGTAAQNATKQVQGLTTALQDQTQALGASAQASKAEILSLEQNIAVRKRLQNTLASVKKDDQENLDLLRQGVITQDEYKKRVLESAVQQEKLSARISEANKGIKDQIKLQNTPANTIARAQAENKQLVAQRNVTPVSDVEGIAKLNEQIDRNNDLIDLNNDKLGKQKINIGNYPTAFTSAFKLLNTELDQVNQKIAAGASGSELAKLTQQQQALQNAVSLTGKEFATTGAQQGAFKEASKQLGVVYGTNSTVFKDFTKEVGKGSQSLKDVSKQVDAAAGGTPKLVKGFQGIFSVIRSIANLIPGLGLSGVVLLLIAPLQAAAESFISLFTSINKGKIAVAALNEVNLKAVQIYSDEKTKVEGLVAVLNDNNSSLGSKKEALKQLIAISPEYLRGLTLENIATAEGKKLLDAFILSLQAKAELEAAISVRADANKSVANLNAEKDALKELAKQGKVSFGDLSESQQKFLDNGSLAGQFKFTADLFNVNLDDSDIKNVLDGIDGEIKKATVKVTASTEIYKDKFGKVFTDGGPKGLKGIIQKLRDEIDSLTKIQPTLLSESDIQKNVAQVKKLQDELDRLLGKEKRTPGGNRVISDLRAQLNTEFDLYKLNQARLIELYKEEAEDQKLPLTKRLDALNSFFIESKKLIGEQEEFDRQAKQREAQRDIDNLNKDKKGKNAAQIARINQNIAIIESNLQEEIKLIEAKGDDERIKASKTFGERRAAIVKSNGDKLTKIIEDTFKDLNAGADKEFSIVNLENEENKYLELKKLNEDFNSGRIKGVNKFEGLKADIEKRYTAAGLQAEINKEEEKKKIAISFFKDTVDIDEKILQLKLKQLGIEVDETRKIADAKLQIEEQLAQKKRELLKAGTDLFISIVDGQFEREKNRIAEAQTEVDKNKERQLAANDALVQSEEKKAANIAIINSRAQVQKEALDRRQKQIDRDKAIFERAAAVFNIGIATAQAIAKIKLQALVFASNPATSFLAVKALTQIPFALAIGALEIAALFAKPIPKFKTGKNNDYEGPAIVGDGGVSEYIERADGSLEKTPAKDTLTYLGKDDIVHKDLMSLMLSRAMPAIGYPAIQSKPTMDSPLIYLELKKLNEGMNKVANKRENHLSAKDGALVSLWKHGANTVKYFEESTNW